MRILRSTAEYLKNKGVDNPRLDAEVLLSHLLKLDRVGLYLNFDRPLTNDELSSFREIVMRRGLREPVSYITGVKEFWSLEFDVSADVLIPRPETEILVEEVLNTALSEYKTGMEATGSLPDSGEEPSNVLNILDMCTGSGCIAVSLARELPNARVSACDVSMKALSIACKNAVKHSVSDRLFFYHGSLYEALMNESIRTLCPSAEGKGKCPEKDNIFDIIASNPPYIRNGDIPDIQPEVREYEPRIAIDGGEEGIDIYAGIISGTGVYLRPGGWLMLEVGDDTQSEAVSLLLEKTGCFSEITRIKDLAGTQRVVRARRQRRL